MKKQSKIAAIVDTETTGTAQYDELIELGMILFEFNIETGHPLAIIDKYVGLRNPSVSIHPRASQVHGLTKADLVGRFLDKTRVKAMFNKADVIIAHNAGFDKRFIIKLFKEVNEKRWLCSMNAIPWKKLGFHSKGLEKLLIAHNVFINQEHRALGDVEHVYNLLSIIDKTTKKPYLYRLIALLN